MYESSLLEVFWPKIKPLQRSLEDNLVKENIMGWEGQGEGCEYSWLQGVSPRLYRLRIIHSGPLKEHLIMY
jgi:hypothetical protein